jgi:2-methylisocitrate lyase-like PEP mutase family enzyme
VTALKAYPFHAGARIAAVTGQANAARQQELVTRFRALHEHGCFAIPNPWDLGTVRALERTGFLALATTSAGFSFSRGRPDALDALSVEDVLAHVAEIAAAAEVPVNADFQSGYAEGAEGVAANVRRCVATGVAGLSIEDATGADALYPREQALERVRAARAAIDESGTGVLLTARAECFLVGDPDPLAESIARLQAYADAGADVLFAPGVRELEQIRAIVQAVAPKPVNVLMSADTGVTLAELAQAGVRRVSVGSALARVAWGAFLQAARQIGEQGSFAGLAAAAPFAELNELFATR